jgi:hypothetical protein
MKLGRIDEFVRKLEIARPDGLYLDRFEEPPRPSTTRDRWNDEVRGSYYKTE